MRSIYIAGFNDDGDNVGFSPFCDINNDGIMELTFYYDYKIYVVGYTAGSTTIESNEIQTINNPNLSQNYPNPFNPTTTINYELTSKGKVKISIYNINGQLIRVLVDKYSNAGQYQITWNGTNSEGKKVSSGTYFYQLKVNDYLSTKKAIFLK